MAKREMVAIHIKQEDIDTGAQRNFNFCPVALAIKRLYPKADIISVNRNEASAYLPEETMFKIFRKSKAKFIRIPLPARVGTFITNFDSYGPKDKHVKPFSFEAIAIKTEQYGVE